MSFVLQLSNWKLSFNIKFPHPGGVLLHLEAVTQRLGGVEESLMNGQRSTSRNILRADPSTFG